MNFGNEIKSISIPSKSFGLRIENDIETEKQV